MTFLERMPVILGGGAIALAGAVAITAQSVRSNAAPRLPANDNDKPPPPAEVFLDVA